MKIERMISSILSKREEIIAGYLYGSYLTKEKYNDIDIALLTKQNIELDHLYKEDLELLIEKEIRPLMKRFVPIDIQIMNGKSLRYLFSILKSSKLLFSNDESKRIQFESDVMIQYIDFKPHIELYNKMRTARYVN